MTHYEWLQEAHYVTAFRDAEEEAADHLEAEARRRAVEGVRRMKFHHGQPIIDPSTGEPYVEHEYSDTLLIFLLKGARPAKFRDNAALHIDGKLKHGGDPGAPPIRHDHHTPSEDLTDEQRLARVHDLLQRAQQRGASAGAGAPDPGRDPGAGSTDGAAGSQG